LLFIDVSATSVAFVEMTSGSDFRLKMSLLRRKVRRRDVTRFFSPHLCSSCVAEYPAREFRSILSIYSVYIGETGRPFVTKLNEHKKEVESKDKTKFTRQRKQSVDEQQNKSAITDHEVKENHVIGWDEASILGREGNYE